ncbi:MAG: hypothetical protein Q7R87_04380 [Nanoarchaeota archaeon]|nr:hypothetical protein [Nanoarchaeota archaeon]
MESTIKDITAGKKAIKGIQRLNAMVNSVAQTAGPSLFSLTDGTGSLIAKAFEGAGVRAYPDIDEGDFVEVVFTMKEYNNMLEADVMKLHKLSGPAADKVRLHIQNLQRERAKPKDVQFLVKNKVLDKLKDRYLKAATEIRLAIIMNRPIIIRHHNDADGYSSGFALERAVLPLILEQHGNKKALATHYTRSPSATPFYEIEDSIKDTAHSLTGHARFAEKIPLTVIVDTGSGEESLLAIKQGRIHGIDFIVVDHHFFEKDVISDEVLVHINPFLVGEDGAKISAGMLCAELAKFINADAHVEYIPAMAGYADMIDNKEIMDSYLKIAEKEGYTKQLLHDIATVIDFVSTKLRFMEAREYVEVLFGEPMAQQKKLVGLLAPYIRGLEVQALEVAKSAVKKEKIGKTNMNLLFIEETFSRGIYPKPGKVNGMLHDFMQKEGESNLLSLGVLSDAVTMRASDESKFSVHEFIAYCKKNIPEAFVNGGGHKNAGAIRFVPSQREKVLEAFRIFIRSK